MHTPSSRVQKNEADKSSGEEQTAAAESSSSVQLKGKSFSEQQAALAPGGGGFDVQKQALSPVQMKGDGNAEAVHAAAERGTSGSGGALPHLDTIQAAFGSHDVSDVQAYSGGSATEATAAMGAEAYATGNKVAFGGPASLHTAAHEAAHVVQQRAGVSLSGGVGKAGDSYEQHADAVADAVVQGRSAEGLLNEGIGNPSGISQEVQRAGAAEKAEAEVQRKSVQMVAPVVLLGMTAAELAGVVSATTSVAVAAGTMMAPQNSTTGKTEATTLAIDTDYLMGNNSRARLGLVARTLYFEECEKLMAGGQPQKDIAQTALGNIKAHLVSVLEGRAKVHEHETVENGEGGSSKITPWGSAKARLHSGFAYPSNFSSTIYATAQKHQVALTRDYITYVKNCSVEYDCEHDVDLFDNDNIYVRGHGMHWRESGAGDLQVYAAVAFDFDGDTVYNYWNESKPMGPACGPPVPSPERVGPDNPDD